MSTTTPAPTTTITNTTATSDTHIPIVTEPSVPRITKRKLDDAISILDSAFNEKGAGGDGASTNSSTSPPNAKRRALGVKSIYATLTKYGFKSNDAPPKDKTSSLRTPRLTALLDKSKNPLSSSTSSASPSHVRSASTSAASTSKTVSSFPTISSPQALMSRPPFRPTSASDFLARLSTFKLATYRDKPRAIDAVFAARCGWRNDGVDRLVCEWCLATWIVGTTAGLSRDAANTLVERHRVAMTASHKENCPWRTRQCEESIYRVPIKGSTIMAREIFNTAVDLTPLVKDITVKHPLTTAQAAHLESTVLSVAPSFTESSTTAVSSSDSPPMTLADLIPPPQVPKPSESALILALFGWEVYTPSPPPSATSSISTSRTPVTLPGASSLARSSTVSSRTSGHARSSSGGSAAASPTVVGGPRRSLAPLSASIGPGIGASGRARARYSYDARGSGTHSPTPPASPLPSSNHLPLFGRERLDGGAVDNTTVLVCQLCQRRIGLWSFLRSSSSHSPGVHGTHGKRTASNGSNETANTGLTGTSVPTLGSSVSGQPQPAPAAQVKERPLDVIKEHRSYCPYIVKSTPMPAFSFSFPTPATAPAAGGAGASKPRPLSTSGPLGGSVSGAPPSSGGGLARVVSHPTIRPSASTSNLKPFPSPVTGTSPDELTEGWRAVLSVVGRAGMGTRRRMMNRRKRSDQVAMEVNMAQHGGGSGTGSLIEDEREEALAELGRSVRMQVDGEQQDQVGGSAAAEFGEIGGAERQVDEMVESVKRGGGLEILRYVKGLLG